MLEVDMVKGGARKEVETYEGKVVAKREVKMCMGRGGSRENEGNMRSGEVRAINSVTCDENDKQNPFYRS